MRLSEFWKRASDELRAGNAVFACMVVGKRKGSPGTTAARLLLTEDGRQYGTIGGGIMEKREVEWAGAWLRAGGLEQPELCYLAHRATDPDSASGLICGGDQTNLRFILRPERDSDTVTTIADAAAAEANALVRIDAVGLRLESLEGCWTGPSVQFREADEAAGKLWSVGISLRNNRRIAVFGGGHCGAALARLMHGLGYAVTVIEPRMEVVKQAGLPGDVLLLEADFAAGGALVKFPEDTHVVVMTYSMLTDVEALSGCLNSGFKSIGVMGSRPKIAKIRSLLQEKGFSRLHVETIRAPIGLGFDSDTPEEIAVSVAAQILMERGENNYG